MYLYRMWLVYQCKHDSVATANSSISPSNTLHHFIHCQGFTFCHRPTFRMGSMCSLTRYRYQGKIARIFYYVVLGGLNKGNLSYEYFKYILSDILPRKGTLWMTLSLSVVLMKPSLHWTTLTISWVT